MASAKAKSATRSAREHARSSANEAKQAAITLSERNAELRTLTKTLGAREGELDAMRKAHAEKLNANEKRVRSIKSAVAYGQVLVREYVDKDSGLLRELIEERRAEQSEGRKSRA